MKKSIFSSSKVLAGKGFYIALSLSVAMIGAACYYAYTETSDQLSAQLDSLDAANSSEQNVANTQTNILKTTTCVTTTTWVTSTTTAVISTTAPQTTAVAAQAQTMAQTTAVRLETEPPATTASAPAPVLPVAGEVLAPFSNGELVKSATTGAWATHNGVDLAAALGDSVVAMLAGTVTAIEEDPLWGVCVTLDHGNGLLSRYCNLNPDLEITAGMVVDSGTPLGTVGETADIETADQSHLHFEVLQNDCYIDPITFISGQ